MIHDMFRWIYHQSPVLSLGSATIVAGQEAGEHPIVSFLRALLIPLTVAAIKFMFENSLPRIKSLYGAWTEAREKRRLATLGSQLAALQLTVAAHLAAITVKDEKIVLLEKKLDELAKQGESEKS